MSPACAGRSMNGIASNDQKTMTPMHVTAASAIHESGVVLAVDTGAIEDGGVASAASCAPTWLASSAVTVAGLDIERGSVLSVAAARHSALCSLASLVRR